MVMKMRRMIWSVVSARWTLTTRSCYCAMVVMRPLTRGARRIPWMWSLRVIGSAPHARRLSGLQVTRNHIKTCIYAYTHTCIHTCIHTYVHTYIHTYMHTCILKYINTYIHAYIPASIHDLQHSRICRSLFKVRLSWTRTRRCHTHTHTHTHNPR
jgi:hypothetical protein